MCTLFTFCSAYSGQHSSGNPAVMPSSVEFQPQCVMNAPVALWRRTSTCGAQDFTTSPLSLVLSKNPSGMSASRSGSRSGSPCFWSGLCGLLTTHRNLSPDFSKPTAISSSCLLENVPRLPKERNTTLWSGCASSQRRHSCSLSPPPETNGPMQYTGGVARPGTQSPSLRALSAGSSNESKELIRIPFASAIRSNMRKTYTSASSSPITSEGSSEALKGGTPGKVMMESPSSFTLAVLLANLLGRLRKMARSAAAEANE
uniref:Uncharacterized protein n=1 Tax=Triticum urartu TaxID=4572 RepID=A0A8R7TXU1_TRIUA